jgi:cysteine-rich repeat protein
MGCLAQADPCSITVAGSGATAFATRSNPGAVGRTPQPVGGLRVAQIGPSTSTVQKLGQAGEYQLARKLYFASLVGFSAVGSTSGDPGAADELTLAHFEANAATINPILASGGFFALGGQTNASFNAPFCEDFDEQTICNPTPATPSTLAANVNACPTNASAGLPTAATVCGNGVREVYEECDDGTANGTTADHCSITCRCVNDFNEATGVCN